MNWPSQAACSKIVFIAKPNGDDRNIGLASTLVRAWQRIRLDSVKDWERSVASHWDASRAGSSALRAGLYRAAVAEIG
eukprot:15315898-Alexandrium_andersonii.AAC.1